MHAMRLQPVALQGTPHAGPAHLKILHGMVDGVGERIARPAWLADKPVIRRILACHGNHFATLFCREARRRPGARPIVKTANAFGPKSAAPLPHGAWGDTHVRGDFLDRQIQLEDASHNRCSDPKSPLDLMAETPAADGLPLFCGQLLPCPLLERDLGNPLVEVVSGKFARPKRSPATAAKFLDRSFSRCQGAQRHGVGRLSWVNSQRPCFTKERTSETMY